MSECIAELVGTPHKYTVGFNRGNIIWSCTTPNRGNIYLQSLECVYYVHKKSLTEKNLLTTDRELRFYRCCNDIPV